MAVLLRRLRTQTNGAVVGAMSSLGVDYPLSYGVSVVDIRREAAAYAPDHDLAKLLYGQQVRELQLSAFYIADSGRITVADADFWASGILSGEMAEHAALMLARSPDAEKIVCGWLQKGPSLLKYAAMMCCARVVLEGNASEWDFKRLVHLLEPAAYAGEPVLDRGLIALVSRLWSHETGNMEYISPLMEKLRVSRPELWNELRSFGAGG